MGISTRIFWSLKKIWHFDNNILKAKKHRAGFTLIEVTAAAVILVVVTFTIMTVINRMVESMVDNASKLTAFKIARNNMESLLGEASVSEMIDFGSLENNPDIEWELAVETFYPTSDEMWMRAVSSASYTGVDGDREYIELTHWLTNLSEAEIKQIEDQRQREREFMEDDLVNPYGDDPEGLMMFQEALSDNGKFLQAAKVALDLLRRYPNSDEAEQAADNARMYARKSSKFGDYGIAADIVIEIASLLPESNVAKQCVDDAMRYANDAAKSGDYREAAEIANKIVEELPESNKAKAATRFAIALARMAAAKGDYRTASAILDDAQTANPDAAIDFPEDVAKEWEDKGNAQPADENEFERPEQKPALSDQEFLKLKNRYINGDIPLSEVMGMTETGQITDSQMFEVAFSNLK